MAGPEGVAREDRELRPAAVDGADRRQLARLRREVRRAGRVRHANVAAPRGVVRTDEGIAVEVDPVAGETLAERLRRDGPCAPSEARRLARDLCAALQAAHARGVAHGRLTTEVVRVAGDRFVLVDLGLEQARRAERIDDREDIRGAGAVLYEALTGTAPFGAAPEALPDSFRAPLLRCLQRDPERRFGSAAELAAALGVPVEPAPADARRRRRRGWLAAAALLLAAGGAAGAWALRAEQEGAAGAGAEPAVAAEPVPPAAPGRPVVAIAPLDAAGAPPWLAAGIRELLLAAMIDDPGIDVVPASSGGAAEARRLGHALVIGGAVAGGDGGLTVDVQLLDVGTGALRLAERATAADADALLAGLDGLLATVRGGIAAALPAGDDGPPGAPLPTRSAEALEAWIAGVAALDAGDRERAEAGLRRAVAHDPAFLPPRARLVELLRAEGRSREAALLLDDVEAPAGPAGPWRELTLAWLRAPTAAAQVDALGALAERYPRDPRLALERAGALRRAGRPGECGAEAARAVALDPALHAAHRDAAWCALQGGDPEAALAAARRHAEARPADGLETLGDVLLQLGRWGAARDAYRRGGDAGSVAAAAKQALVDVHGRGRCAAADRAVRKLRAGAEEGAIAAGREAVARAWAAAALACDDLHGAREAEAWARRAVSGPAVADELAVAIAAARGGAAWERAIARAADDEAWASGTDDRARRFGPVLAAGRASRRSAEALAAVPSPPQPQDRYPFWGPPLLLEVALAKIDAGDPEEGALACAEVAAAAPGYAPALWCQGRAAEAREAWSEAFRHYRAFLDRWSEADEEHRLVRDARRRLAHVVRRARAARGE